MMTQTRPTELHQRRILMTRKPAAAAEARSQVRAVVRAWEIPVDPDIAVLLTSDLVTHAVIGWNSATITLAVRCSHDQLRVDVYDTSLPLPMAVDEQAITQTRPGLAWRKEIDSFDPASAGRDEPQAGRHAGDQVTVGPRSVVVLRGPRAS